MAGIYVHIPFCKQACTYCDFHFSTNLSNQDQLTQAICLEIEQRKKELDSKPQTLYFGGGSPSILSDHNMILLMEQLNRHFDLSQLTETTIETNPDDHSEEKLAFWKSLGFDRLSIGIQSFVERDLRWMNRAHSAHEAVTCVAKAAEAGFEKHTIDLIYGIPNQSMKEWESNIGKAIDLGVNHISAYCLTVEAKTALAHRVNKGLDHEKSHEVIEQEFHLLQDHLKRAGFRQYELSNFTKPGFEAVHNANYWSGKPYLGLGPSAHSFDGESKRRWNVANNMKYIKGVPSNSYTEGETLTETDRVNEQLMTSLRTAVGLEKVNISDIHWDQIMRQVDQMPAALQAMLDIDEIGIKTKPKHWLMSDAVIRELMIA